MIDNADTATVPVAFLNLTANIINTAVAVLERHPDDAQRREKVLTILRDVSNDLRKLPEPKCST